MLSQRARNTAVGLLSARECYVKLMAQTLLYRNTVDSLLVKTMGLCGDVSFDGVMQQRTEGAAPAMVSNMSEAADFDQAVGAAFA